MAAVRAAEPPEWITPGQGLGALLKAGRRPDDARLVLFRGLQSGSFIGRADRIVFQYSDDSVTEQVDHEVQCDVWRFCPLPPFGHRFWSVGDILVRPDAIPDGADLSIAGVRHEIPFGYLPPTITVRGFRIPALALVALGGVFDLPAGRGRRRGVGGYAKADAPLVLEMHRLRQEQPGTSVNAAAVKMAPKAAGPALEQSKVNRLTAHYKATYPDSP